MKRQRAVAIILALAAVLCLTPALALADEEDTVSADEYADALTAAEATEPPETSEETADDLDGGDTDASALPASVSLEEDDEQALCAHGNAEADCAVCAVEAQIAALPSAAEAESLGDDGQSQVYAQASAAYDAYCALTQEEQAQVSNSDALFALLDFFSGGTATTAEEEDLCENCGSGYYDNGICTGCGAYQSAELNENGCYEIGNAGQLFWFAALVNGGSTSASAVLTADIDLNPGFSFSAQDGTYTGSGTPRSWTPIGGGSSSSNAYAGSFDGNGHTVSGIYINASTMYQGLFGGLYGGTVQNVTVSNSSITGTQYVGGIAGKLVANNVITGCVNNGYVKGSSSSSTYTGGIAGYIYNSTVSGCTNHGNVAGAGYYVGGVVGLAASGASTCVTDCHNTGDVSGSSQYVGGVIGYIKSSCTTDIANCSNSGNITGGSYYAGGVIGYASITATVVNCSNEGDVSAGGYDVGGIVGYLPSSNGISTCCNSGNISGTTYVGGIVGNASVSTGYSIADCLNIGSVSATASSGTPYAGGIIGAFNKGTLMNCCSVGNVSGSSVGGIAGYVASSGTIDNSYYLDTAADSAVASNNASGTVSAEAKNAEAFASGEVTWLLNGGEDGATDGTQIWYQTLGQSDIPAFSGATVYYEEGRGWFNADQPTVYSVEIAWGDLAFTYQSATDVWNPETHQYESAASSVWSWADGGNIITVTNGSNASVSVSVSYQPAEGYSGILGSFDKTSSLLTPLGTDSFALSLSAADDSILQALQESTCIGAVVVTIGTDNTDSH